MTIYQTKEQALKELRNEEGIIISPEICVVCRKPTHVLFFCKLHDPCSDLLKEGFEPREPSKHELALSKLGDKSK